MSDYTLDASSAKKADVKFSNIEVSAPYKGVFTRAEKVVSEKGTKGVDLSFKAVSGEQADYLTLWTHNKEGKALMGFDTLNAIMTCLRIKSLTAISGEVEKYVKEKGGRAKVTADIFPELMNTPIGLVIQMEESEYQGKRNMKPIIYCAFDKDGFTASEILSKATKAEVLDKMVAVLKDKLMKPSALPVRQDGVESEKSENPGHGMNDQFDETIPF